MNIAFAGLRHSHIFALADMARSHPLVNVTGAWEEDSEARASAAAMFPEGFYETYEDLLNDPGVDVVAVGDYYGIRGERVIRALRAGKHVISDKPVCTSPGEIDSIEALCRDTGLCLGCMLDLRYDPALRLARDMISAGDIGEVRAVAFTGQHPLNRETRPAWYFQEGRHGGTFNDIAIHGVDAIRYVTGLEFGETLCARQWNSYADHAPDFRDCAQFMAKLENSAGVMADVSYSAPAAAAFSLDSYWRFTFWGAKGWIECRLGGGEVKLAVEGSPEARIVPAPPVKGGCLDDLIADIGGGDTEFGTASVIASSRAALMIQKFADETGKE